MNGGTVGLTLSGPGNLSASSVTSDVSGEAFLSYTIPAGSAAGSATITATFAGVSDTVVIPPAISVSVTPTSASLVPGATRQFTATVTGAANTAVTWTATGGTISASGLYTAGSTTGSYTVTATSVEDTSRSASVTVTIAAAGPVTILHGTGSGVVGGDLGVDGTGIGVQEWDDDENTICCAPVVLAADSPPPVSLALAGTTLGIGRVGNMLGIDVTGTAFSGTGSNQAGSMSQSATRARLTSGQSFALDVAVDPAWHDAGQVEVYVVVTETGDRLYCDGRDPESNGTLTFTCSSPVGNPSGPTVSWALPAGTYTIDVIVTIGGGGADSSGGSGRVVTLTTRP